MTDQPPIVVNASPVQDQIAAGLRVFIIAAGSVATALGYAGVAGKLNALLLAVGPVAAAIAFLVGQLKTRALAKKAARMATLLPDSVATTK